MKLSRISIHTEQTLVAAIHRLAETATVCRVAVAYCGADAHRFFPEPAHKRPEEMRIVVDASAVAVRRGLTNPVGVEHLLGLADEIRSLQGLHAKVFVFDDQAALVGSANMSASSIARQYQVTLEVTDQAIARKLVKWFDSEIWNRARPLSPAGIRKLKREWRQLQAQPLGPTHAKLPSWRGDAPQLPLEQADFSVGIDKREIKRLLTEFRTNECPYSEGQSCSEWAKQREAEDNARAKLFRDLWRRRESWGRSELVQLFELAYTHGRAAQINKPAFLRQRAEKVAQSLTYLLEGPGDPYLRFEKVLSDASPYKLTGIGEAGLIFLMHLWRPKEFPVLNQSVARALRALRISFGRQLSRRKGQALKDRTAAVNEIVRLTGLRNYSRVDHFLDAIGKRHIAPPRG